VNVIEFANPAASLDYLQSQERNDQWLTGYQVNQWSVTVEGDGISPTEVTKLEKAENSGSVIINRVPLRHCTSFKSFDQMDHGGDGELPSSPAKRCSSKWTAERHGLVVHLVRSQEHSRFIGSGRHHLFC
jgi:hypothetical protein